MISDRQPTRTYKATSVHDKERERRKTLRGSTSFYLIIGHHVGVCEASISHLRCHDCLTGNQLFFIMVDSHVSRRRGAKAMTHTSVTLLSLCHQRRSLPPLKLSQGFCASLYLCEWSDEFFACPRGLHDASAEHRCRARTATIQIAMIARLEEIATGFSALGHFPPLHFSYTSVRGLIGKKPARVLCSSKYENSGGLRRSSIKLRTIDAYKR